MAVEQNVRKKFLKLGVEGSLLKPEVIAGVKRMYGDISFVLPNTQLDPINQKVVDTNRTPLGIGSIEERLDESVRIIHEIMSKIDFKPQA